MSTVGFIYHPDYLKHDTGIGHPERPQRLETLVQHLLNTPLWRQLSHLRPEPASLEQIHKVHPERYSAMIKVRCLGGEQILDGGDTHVCRESYNVALLAAGGVLQGVDEVMTGKLNSAFCAVRPPGHPRKPRPSWDFASSTTLLLEHATPSGIRGRDALRSSTGMFTTGTAPRRSFTKTTPFTTSAFISYPYYPGTGAANERGEGKGEGFTLNCPMGAGSVEKDYLDAFHAQILPALHKFQPQLVMISAGFDAHTDDQLAHVNLTEDSFAKMTELVADISSKYSGGRIVSVLEGGYNLQALARSVESHLRVLSQ